MAKKKKKKISRRGGRGNFKKVSPSAAQKYLAVWHKKNVKTADQIPAGPNADVQKIRFREAQAVVIDYQRALAKHREATAKYEALLKQYKALGKRHVFEHLGLRSKHLRPTKPKTPSAKVPSGKNRGNFKRVTKVQARAYLRGLCAKAKDGPEALTKALQGEIKATSAGGDARTPRLQEAITLVGFTELANIHARCLITRQKAEKRAAEKRLAAEARKEKANKAKLARWQREIDACEQKIANAKKAMAATKGVAPIPASTPSKAQARGWTTRPSGLVVPASKRRKRRHAR